MNIAILHCLKATKVCTGAACFKAYNNGEHSFAQYEDKPVLCAFFNCGGCESSWSADSDMLKKMKRLQSEGVERIHVGVCIGEKCVHRNEIFNLVEQFDMEVVLGTH